MVPTHGSRRAVATAGVAERERVAHEHVGAGRQPLRLVVGLFERRKHELLHHHLPAAPRVHHPRQRRLVAQVDVGTERRELEAFLLHGRPIARPTSRRAGRWPPARSARASPM